jgi:hypothetical protein
MKRGGHVQPDRSFRTAFFQQFARPINGVRVTGYHNLDRRINICRAADPAVAASLHAVSIVSRSAPRIAAIAPTPTGTALLHIFAAIREQFEQHLQTPKLRRDQRRIFAETVACNKIRFRDPLAFHRLYAATDVVKIAGCVLAVSWRSLSFPEKHMSERGKPSASSAASKIDRAPGNYRRGPSPFRWIDFPVLER